MAGGEPRDFARPPRSRRELALLVWATSVVAHAFACKTETGYGGQALHINV